MWDDLRFSLRILRRFKLYSVASTITLALGIGAATAVFSVIDATLLRPLPYRDPDRLVALNSIQPGPSGTEQSFPVSRPELAGWRSNSLFEGIEAIESRTVAITGSGEPLVVSAGAITSGLFPMLGIAPAMGRMFSAEEERQNAAVAILSHSLWMNRFGGSPGILGQAIILAGRPHSVIGIMPRSFRLLFEPSSVWTPLNPVIDPARPNNRFLFAIGRLRGTTAPAQAQSELAAISTQVAKEFPRGHTHARPTVVPLHAALFGDRAPALWMLAITVIGLLTLACANVANLTLGHLSMRQGELATRALVGAGSARLVWMLVLQTGIMALAGAALALIGVAVALPLLVDLYNGGGLGVVSLGIDWRVVALSLMVVGGTTVLCSAIPALKIQGAASRGEALRMAAVRFSASRWERRLKAMLVSAQVGIAVALLGASGTLMTSLDTVLATPPGFTATGVLTMQMLLPTALYPDISARANVVRRMLDRVSGLPGIGGAGTTQSTFLPDQSNLSMMHVEGVHIEEPELTHLRHVTPGYLDVLRVPMIEGRPIDNRDQVDTPLVCMVSQVFAKKYFPQGGVLGHRVRRAGATVYWMTIVGVVADVRDIGLTSEPGPVLYVPYLQLNTATAQVSLVARTAGDPMQMAASVRQAIWEVDRNQPIDRIASLEDILLEGASAERFRTLLVSIFAIVGLVLAVVGVYAVTSASVTARTWEASLRLALGARPWGVAGAMVREAAGQIAAGVALGIGGFYLFGRVISGLLFQTGATDLSIILAASTGTVALALCAAAWQSRRLAAVSPALGLRGQADPQ